MAYFINFRDIQVGVVMKTQDNVMYQIERVLGAEDPWDAHRNGFRPDGSWIVEVKIIRGVNLDYANDENKEGLNRDTVFKIRKHPNTLCAWIHNVSEKELDRLRLLGRISY